MNIQEIPSKLLDNAVNEFARLPGIGAKTAMRLVLHLLNRPESEVESFANSLLKLKKEIKNCKICNNISDTEVCNICSSPSRDFSTVCVVENIRDVMAIEKTHQYKGIYHVLGGVISPMDGIGPDDLNISRLAERVTNGEVKELILALSTTMEGDTTNFFIYRKFAETKVKITTLARGVAVGDELEYADEVTLGRSIVNRTPFESGFMAE